jgi:thiol-disulfide isomerase/thioredoxin
MGYSSVLLFAFFMPPDYGLIEEKPTDRYLFFTASWCSGCNSKVTKDYIEKIKNAKKYSVGEADTDTFRLVNTDKNPTLVQKYDVRLIPCIVRLRSDGTIVGKRDFNGGKGFEELAKLR